MPLGREQILAALQNFGPFQSEVLLVHSSLSGCGQVHGGARTVTDALRSWIAPASLAMPTHSYCYGGEDGAPTYFDHKNTPSTVGAITDWFWRQPGVARSLHPTHSLAAAGPLAGDLCEGHERTQTPCGQGTPYEKLAQRKTSVLMFGARLDAYTLFHTAEDAAEVPYLYESRKSIVSYTDDYGINWQYSLRRHNMLFLRRFAEMDSWFEQRALLLRGKLGLGELLYLPDAGKAHRMLVEELRRNPWLLVEEASRPKTIASEPVNVPAPF
jgi:aminoglycoside 3-N-acetyltransferase